MKLIRVAGAGCMCVWRGLAYMRYEIYYIALEGVYIYVAPAYVASTKQRRLKPTKHASNYNNAHCSYLICAN